MHACSQTFLVCLHWQMKVTELLDLLTNNISLCLWSQEKVQQVPKTLTLSSTALDFLIPFQSWKSAIPAGKIRADCSCFHTGSIYFSLSIHSTQPQRRMLKRDKLWKAESHWESHLRPAKPEHTTHRCVCICALRISLTNFKKKKKVLMSTRAAQNAERHRLPPAIPFNPTSLEGTMAEMWGLWSRRGSHWEPCCRIGCAELA